MFVSRPIQKLYIQISIDFCRSNKCVIRGLAWSYTFVYQYRDIVIYLLKSRCYGFSTQISGTTFVTTGTTSNLPFKWVILIYQKDLRTMIFWWDSRATESESRPQNDNGKTALFHLKIWQGKTSDNSKFKVFERLSTFCRCKLLSRWC